MATCPIHTQHPPPPGLALAARYLGADAFSNHTVVSEHVCRPAESGPPLAVAYGNEWLLVELTMSR